MPINWRAYEDIADFFTNDVQDHRRRACLRSSGLRQIPSVAGLAFFRFLVIAGRYRRYRASFGRPVDDWGIRVEGCVPVGASVSRGGETNGPSSVYALQKYIDWLTAYAPPEARDYTFDDIGTALQKGNIAQMNFLYRQHPGTDQARLAAGQCGRHAALALCAQPHGSYWEEG